uniref:DEK-C domain-containing protein n=2 Tax=Davidia involucrata TaxID=16924 RepID=A0A5B7A4L7_DAVIN
MGEEEKVTEVAEAVANGTSQPEKMGEPVVEKKEEEKDGVNEMEEDGKDDEKVETHKMDIDQEDKEIKETKEEEEKEEKESKAEEKEEKEETKSGGMDEEIGVKENEESEEKVEGKANGSKEEEERAEKNKQVQGSKKRGKGKSAGEKMNNKKKELEEKKEKEQKTPVASAIERPVRERKSVERLVASIEKDAVKEFHIEKGRGTALKDIPNVAYKLARRKTDDTFKLLHTILFGRRGKALQVRNNISQFSGFVWNENEEKQKIKVKEKFDKCVKEKLLEFCDVLDIPIAKANTRKEDIVMKLIDFLVAPHAMTTELLAEKEQSSKGKKRKRVAKRSASMSGGTPSKRSAKSRRKIENTSKGEEKRSTPETEDELEEEEEEDHEEEENVNGVPERSKDELPEHSESEEKENESEHESEEDTGKQRLGSKKSSTKKESAGKTKTKKVTTTKKSSPPSKRTPTKSSSNRLKVDNSSDTSPKMFSRKKKNEEVVKEKSPTPKKSSTREKTGKKVVKGKDKPKQDKLRPSDDELRNAICKILKEVDFNTATFTDILKQLAGRFNMDLTPRKSSIKLMIQDELTKLADEAGDEEDEGDAEKEETQPSGKGVEV